MSDHVLVIVLAVVLVVLCAFIVWDHVAAMTDERDRAQQTRRLIRSVREMAEQQAALARAVEAITARVENLEGDQ